MSAGQSQLLPGAVDHAPVPALALDAGHRVIDYNVALEALVGPEVSGCRDQLLGEFLGIVSPRVEGPMLPHRLSRRGGHDQWGGPGGDPNSPAGCVFRSDDFGRVRLACTALECHDIATGRSAGALVLWESARSSARTRFTSGTASSWTSSSPGIRTPGATTASSP